MSKPKFLKLLAVIEEDYKAISGDIEFADGSWQCENVMTVKLTDNFDPESIQDFKYTFDKFIDLIMAEARLKSKEESELNE